MQELKPYTLYNSISSKATPSILLTQDFRKFLFIQPLSQEFNLAQNIYSLIHEHFKIMTLSIGSFKLKGTNYVCGEMVDGKMNAESWIHYFCNTKTEANHLLNPHVLFRMYLTNMYFPVFSDTRKFIVFGKKDAFVLNGYPELSNQNGLQFKPITPQDLSMTDARISNFFRWIKTELLKTFEEYKALHHENLFQEIKYKISLYPDIRNQYWDEIKKCLTPEFKQHVHKEINQYLLNL